MYTRARDSRYPTAHPYLIILPRVHACRYVVYTHTPTTMSKSMRASSNNGSNNGSNLGSSGGASKDEGGGGWWGGLMGGKDEEPPAHLAAFSKKAGEAELDALAGLPIKLKGVHDYAVVLADGKVIGTLYRNDPPPKMTLPVGCREVQVVVEVMARANFGPRGLEESKGLVGGVFFGAPSNNERELFGWRSIAVPFNGSILAERLGQLPWQKVMPARGEGEGEGEEGRGVGGDGKENGRGAGGAEGEEEDGEGGNGAPCLFRGHFLIESTQTETQSAGGGAGGGTGGGASGGGSGGAGAGKGEVGGDGEGATGDRWLYLDTAGFTKGFAVVNGFNLGT